MKPEQNETQQDFIKRGINDEGLEILYPELEARISHLNAIFDQEFKSSVSDFRIRLLQALVGPKGDKGEPGEKGLNGKDGESAILPVKGQDYFTPEEIASIVDDVLSRVEVPAHQIIDKTITKVSGVSMKEVTKAIEEAIANTEIDLDGLAIKKALESLRDRDKLDASALQNLPQSKTVVMGGGGLSDPGAASTTSSIRVVTEAGDIAAIVTDYIIVVNKDSGEATTVNLPAGIAGQVLTIKDGKRDALLNNITVMPAAGDIDGSGTYVMNLNYQSATFVYNGIQWNVI